MRIRAPRVNARRGQPGRRQTFSDKKNDAERFLNDPVLKIQNAQPSESKKAEKREQLIAPFHEAM